MELTARLDGISRDLKSREYKVTFSVGSIPEGLEEMQGDLSVSLKPKRNRRSLDANAMLWACLGELGNALGEDPWQVYLQMLRRYGQYTYIIVKPGMVPAVQAQWRETMVVGESEINGQKAVQMLCFFGSSTYDTAEFSKLLNGVIGEMQDVGLQPPPSGDLRRALEKWEKRHEKHSA